MEQQDAAAEDQQRRSAQQMAEVGARTAGFSLRRAAVGPLRIDLARLDLAKREPGRDEQRGRDPEDRAGREQVTDHAHCRGRQPGADRCEARIAAQALADGGRPDQAEADGGHGGTEHAACRGMQGGGGEHDREDRPGCVGDGAGADQGHRDARRQPLGSHGIEQRAAGNLADQRHQAGDGEHEADIDLRPFLRRQIDRDEGAEAGLHVGHEEDEPIEPAQAASRGPRRGAEWRGRAVLCHRWPAREGVPGFPRRPARRSAGPP